MEASSRKRKASEEPEPERQQPPKTCRIDTSLLSLSDHVILEIIKYLKSTDLLVLSQVCLRLSAIAADESLWKVVDTAEKPVVASEFRKILKFASKKTIKFVIGGFASQSRNNLTPSILEVIRTKCPDVKEFTLTNCHIDANEYVNF